MYFECEGKKVLQNVQGACEWQLSITPENRSTFSQDFRLPNCTIGGGGSVSLRRWRYALCIYSHTLKQALPLDQKHYIIQTCTPLYPIIEQWESFNRKRNRRTFWQEKEANCIRNKGSDSVAMKTGGIARPSFTLLSLPSS